MISAISASAKSDEIKIITANTSSMIVIASITKPGPDV
jgi:hypothetical protein